MLLIVAGYCWYRSRQIPDLISVTQTLFLLFCISLGNYFYPNIGLYLAGPVLIAWRSQLTYRYLNLINYGFVIMALSVLPNALTLGAARYASELSTSFLIAAYLTLTAFNLWQLFLRLREKFTWSDLCFIIISSAAIIELLTWYLLSNYLVVNIQNIIFYGLLVWVIKKSSRLVHIFPAESNLNIGSN